MFGIDARRIIRSMPATVDGARREIAGLVADPPPGALLADAAVRALGRVIGHDGYCLFGVDPTTGLRSVMFSRHGLTVPTEVLLHNETVEHDANRYADLVRASVPVGVLSPTGTPRSQRLHEILPGDGYRSELRLALTTPGRYWGALSLFRCDVHRPFADREIALARDLAPELIRVLRRYQIGRPHERSHSEQLAGVVCLDAHDHVLGTDAEAGRSLAAWTDHWVDGVVSDDVMRCVHEVAGAARGGAPARARTRTADGRWLVVSGSYLGGSDVDVVVQLHAGDADTVLPAFAAWCGLSDRETDVLRLILQGFAAKQIARRLGISVLTVGDHQRSLYRKAGVHGRDELVSLLV
jgi:DNA-binding CsgD family transcriptional regulator